MNSQPFTSSAPSEAATRAAFAAAIVAVFDLARFFVLPLLRLPGTAPLTREIDAILPITMHLLLFPVVAALTAPIWARAAGWGWLAIDISTDILALNGAPATMYLPLRYGGHVSAALWIAAASWQGRGALRVVGLLLALDLGAYSFVAPFVSFVGLLPSLVLLPAWFVLVGRKLARARTDAGAAASGILAILGPSGAGRRSA